MASAQVLSKPAVSSRKKKDLEAGKRLLEEFRKKKGAAKRESSTSQAPTDNATLYEKQVSENGQTLSVNPINTLTDGGSDIVSGASVFTDQNDKSHVSHQIESESVLHAHVDTQTDNFSSLDLLEKQPKQVGSSRVISASNHQTGFDFPQQTDFGVGSFENYTGERKYADAVSANRDGASLTDSKSDSLSNLYSSDKDSMSGGSFPNTNVSTNTATSKGYSEGYGTKASHQVSDLVHSSMDLQASALDHSHSHVDLKNQSTFGLEERKPVNVVGSMVGFGSEQVFEPHSLGVNSNIGGFLNGPSYSDVAEPFSRRSRPSFLDSIVKDSSVSGHPFFGNDNFMSSKFSSSNIAASSSMHNPSTVSSPAETLPAPAYSTPSNGFFSNASQEFTSQKQNDDFAALEQHIEDLTQEKYSLQRTLEASKVLTESLAAENSSLTESYNQQASVVNQLKAEMEGLQAEIKALLVELEAIKGEYMNAQLECNAADERAKLLASEVISLEEKALRLRSNELKLERELENSSAEIASYKKKMSSLDKERRDMSQTIDALQEEKKLLQSKLRKASSSGISVDLNNGHVKKDASTSTVDLGLDADGDSSGQALSNMQMLDIVDNLQLLETNPDGHENLSTSIPPDQMQMIQNINSLIREITSEKEELMQALITEVSTSTKLKELNKELSQKLEGQTQRLELLTAQSMASDNVPIKQPTSSHVVRESATYADEGDEVVERVLGWIMKLFPGGPSKRRTSRL